MFASCQQGRYRGLILAEAQLLILAERTSAAMFYESRCDEHCKNTTATVYIDGLDGFFPKSFFSLSTVVLLIIGKNGGHLLNTGFHNKSAV